MLPFRHPTTILISGPTGCGKTQFLVELMERKMLQPSPQRIIWVYGEWQPAYDQLKRTIRPKIEFMKDFDEGLYESLDPKVRNLAVLDDQMANTDMHKGGGSKLSKFFTQGSHHRNLTVIYIVQNMYHRAVGMRDVALNSHYQVLFANPRDKTQIRTLALQMYPTKSRFLMDAFDDATSKPYGYLVLDLKPDSPSAIRVRTSIFDRGNQIVYLPNDEEPDEDGLSVPI